MPTTTNDSFRYCQDCPSSADDAAGDPDSTEDTPSRQSPSTRTNEPIEGQQGTVTLDELFFILSHGAIGTKPRETSDVEDGV